jgi:hypothetical protein
MPAVGWMWVEARSGPQGSQLEHSVHLRHENQPKQQGAQQDYRPPSDPPCECLVAAPRELCLSKRASVDSGGFARWAWWAGLSQQLPRLGVGCTLARSPAECLPTEAPRSIPAWQSRYQLPATGASIQRLPWERLPLPWSCTCLTRPSHARLPPHNRITPSQTQQCPVTPSHTRPNHSQVHYALHPCRHRFLPGFQPGPLRHAGGGRVQRRGSPVRCSGTGGAHRSAGGPLGRHHAGNHMGNRMGDGAARPGILFEPVQACALDGGGGRSALALRLGAASATTAAPSGPFHPQLRWASRGPAAAACCLPPGPKRSPYHAAFLHVLPCWLC